MWGGQVGVKPIYYKT